jgi:hypothetical protein
VYYVFSKGGKNPTFPGRCIGNFDFNAKNLIFANKTMVLFELPPCVFQPTIVIKGEKTPTFFQLMHWIFYFDAKKSIKLNKPEFCCTCDDWIFWKRKIKIKKTRKCPTVKKPCGISPGFQ